MVGLKVGEGFDIVAMEVVFHNAIEYFFLFASGLLDVLQQESVEGFVGELADLQVAFAGLQMDEVGLNVKTGHFIPQELVLEADLDQLNVFHEVLPTQYFLLNIAAILLNVQIKNYRQQFCKFGEGGKDELLSVEGVEDAYEGLLGEFAQVYLVGIWVYPCEIVRIHGKEGMLQIQFLRIGYYRGHQGSIKRFFSPSCCLS